MSTNTTTSQKQAVIDAISTVLGNSFVSGETNVREVLTSEQLEQVRDLVANGILNGDVTFGKDTSDADDVRRYVNGMIDNHIRKAKELNGGSKYVAAKTRGPRDEQLSTLKKLLKTYEEGSAQYKQVLSAISTRQNEILAARSALKNNAPRKARATKNIDMSILPPELQNILGPEVSA